MSFENTICHHFQIYFQGKPKFDAEIHLLGENGLKMINEQFAKVKWQTNEGSAAANLSKLLRMYKEASFLMFPSTNFGDVISKTEKCSGKACILNFMQEMRDKRDGYSINGKEEDINCFSDEFDEDFDLEQKENGNQTSVLDNMSVGVHGNRNKEQGSEQKTNEVKSTAGFNEEKNENKEDFDIQALLRAEEVACDDELELENMMSEF